MKTRPTRYIQKRAQAATNIRLPKALLKDLTRLAADDGRTRNSLIVKVLATYAEARK